MSGTRRATEGGGEYAAPSPDGPASRKRDREGALYAVTRNVCPAHSSPLIPSTGKIGRPVTYVCRV